MAATVSFHRYLHKEVCFKAQSVAKAEGSAFSSAKGVWAEALLASNLALFPPRFSFSLSDCREGKLMASSCMPLC